MPVGLSEKLKQDGDKIRRVLEDEQSPKAGILSSLKNTDNQTNVQLLTMVLDNIDAVSEAFSQNERAGNLLMSPAQAISSDAQNRNLTDIKTQDAKFTEKFKDFGRGLVGFFKTEKSVYEAAENRTGIGRSMELAQKYHGQVLEQQYQDELKTSSNFFGTAMASTKNFFKKAWSATKAAFGGTIEDELKDFKFNDIVTFLNGTMVQKKVDGERKLMIKSDSVRLSFNTIPLLKDRGIDISGENLYNYVYNIDKNEVEENIIRPDISINFNLAGFTFKADNISLDIKEADASLQIGSASLEWKKSSADSEGEADIGEDSLNMMGAVSNLRISKNEILWDEANLACGNININDMLLLEEINMTLTVEEQKKLSPKIQAKKLKLTKKTGEDSEEQDSQGTSLGVDNITYIYQGGKWSIMFSGLEGKLTCKESGFDVSIGELGVKESGSIITADKSKFSYSINNEEASNSSIRNFKVAGFIDRILWNSGGSVYISEAKGELEAGASIGNANINSSTAITIRNMAGGLKSFELSQKLDYDDGKIQGAIDGTLIAEETRKNIWNINIKGADQGDKEAGQNMDEKGASAYLKLQGEDSGFYIGTEDLFYSHTNEENEDGELESSNSFKAGNSKLSLKLLGIMAEANVENLEYKDGKLTYESAAFNLMGAQIGSFMSIEQGTLTIRNNTGEDTSKADKSYELSIEKMDMSFGSFTTSISFDGKAEKLSGDDKEAEGGWLFDLDAKAVLSKQTDGGEGSGFELNINRLELNTLEKKGSMESGDIKFNFFDKEFDFNVEGLEWDEKDYSFKKIEASIEDISPLDILSIEKPALSISKTQGSPYIDKAISGSKVKLEADNVFYEGGIQILNQQGEWIFITQDSTIEFALPDRENKMFFASVENFSIDSKAQSFFAEKAGMGFSIEGVSLLAVAKDISIDKKNGFDFGEIGAVLNSEQGIKLIGDYLVINGISLDVKKSAGKFDSVTLGGSVGSEIGGFNARVEDLTITRSITQQSWSGGIKALSLSIGDIFSVGASDVSFDRDGLEFNTTSDSAIHGAKDSKESDDSLKISQLMPETKRSTFGFMGFFQNYIMKPRHIVLSREKGFSITDMEEEESEGSELSSSLPFLNGKIKLSDIENGKVNIDTKYPSSFDINAKYPIDGALSFSPSIPVVEYGFFSLYIGGTIYAGIAIKGSYKTSLDKEKNMVCLSTDGITGQYKAGARLTLGIRLGVEKIANIKGEGFAEASTDGAMQISGEGVSLEIDGSKLKLAGIDGMNMVGNMAGLVKAAIGVRIGVDAFFMKGKTLYEHKFKDFDMGDYMAAAQLKYSEADGCSFEFIDKPKFNFNKDKANTAVEAQKSKASIDSIMETENQFLAWAKDSGDNNEAPPRKLLVEKANEIKRNYTVQLYKNKNLLILNQLRYGDYCFETESKLKDSRTHIKKQTLRKENEEKFRQGLSKITPEQLETGQVASIEIFMTDNDSISKIISAHINNIKSMRQGFQGLWNTAKGMQSSMPKAGKGISDADEQKAETAASNISSTAAEAMKSIKMIAEAVQKLKGEKPLTRKLDKSEILQYLFGEDAVKAVAKKNSDSDFGTSEVMEEVRGSHEALQTYDPNFIERIFCTDRTKEDQAEYESMVLAYHQLVESQAKVKTAGDQMEKIRRVRGQNVEVAPSGELPGDSILTESATQVLAKNTLLKLYSKNAVEKAESMIDTYLSGTKSREELGFGIEQDEALGRVKSAYTRDESDLNKELYKKVLLRTFVTQHTDSRISLYNSEIAKIEDKKLSFQRNMDLLERNVQASQAGIQRINKITADALIEGKSGEISAIKAGQGDYETKYIQAEQEEKEDANASLVNEHINEQESRIKELDGIVQKESDEVIQSI